MLALGSVVHGAPNPLPSRQVPYLAWMLFAMAVGQVVPAAFAAFFATRLCDAVKEARAAAIAQARHPQTSCIVVCARGNAEDNLPPAVGCVPQPRIGDAPMRFGRAPSRGQLAPVPGLPALGALEGAWATPCRPRDIEEAWVKYSFAANYDIERAFQAGVSEATVQVSAGTGGWAQDSADVLILVFLAPLLPMRYNPVHCYRYRPFVSCGTRSVRLGW